MPKIPFRCNNGSLPERGFSRSCRIQFNLLLKVRHVVIHRYFFLSLLSFGCCVLLLLNACAAPSKPTQIFLEKEKIASLNSILLTVSVAEASVEYSQLKQHALPVPLFGPVVWLIEDDVRRSDDQKTADVTVRTLPKEWCQQIVRKVSQDQLTGKRGIQIHNIQTPPTPMESQQFLSKGYSAFLSLDLVQLCLRLTTGGMLAMYAEMHGQLTELASGRLVWSRYESAISEQSYPIEGYMFKEGEVLRKVADGLVTKVTQRLVYDFVYAQ
jgi:hypothetical protein